MRTSRNTGLLAFASLLCVATASLSASQFPSYSAIEVDKFAAARGVTFPAEHQTALVDEIAREASVAFITVIILHEGETVPDGYTALRLTGLVTRFKPGDTANRYWIGFGIGTTALQAQVIFSDAANRQVLLTRAVRGTGESLGKKIVKILKTYHLVEPK
jgi:hypothetical protein